MNLTELRKNSGLKANYIAKQLNISRVQLYNLESGKYKISLDKIVKFSEVYRKPAEEILKAVKESENFERQ